MNAVCFYISGHGFGHASRQIEIINALGRSRPDIALFVRTSAPAWLFNRTVRTPFTLIPGDVDTGVVQIDSLNLDEAATIREADAFYRTLPARVADEVSLLGTMRAGLVVSDAPPLACVAATAAGVPSVVIANFTWDWIYEAYTEWLATAPGLLPAIRNAYREARAGWRLPMHGGFASFDTIVDVAFVARHATHSRAAARRLLALPPDACLVLSSFGGYGVRDLDLSQLDCLDRYEVVFTAHRPGDYWVTTRAGVHIVSEATLYGSGLRYEDLVAAVDVVVTKPGYGIIAECLANGTGMLYTSRGRFAEYDVLVAEMPRFLRSGFINQDGLLSGRWRDALDRVIAAPAPPERPLTNGADVIADMIAQLLPKRGSA